MGNLLHDLLATCQEDLARLDALPTSALAARRELMHRIEGALALVIPMAEDDVFTLGTQDLELRERTLRERVRALEVSLAVDDPDVASA